MAPTLKKLLAHTAFGLSVRSSIRPSIRVSLLMPASFGTVALLSIDIRFLSNFTKALVYAIPLPVDINRSVLCLCVSVFFQESLE